MAKSSRAKSSPTKPRRGPVVDKVPPTIAIRIDSRGDVLLHLPASTFEEVFEVGRRVKFRKGLKVGDIDTAVAKAVAGRRTRK